MEEESKPKETQPRARTYEEFMALKVEPQPCGCDGCDQKVKKHCCGFAWDGASCRKLAYCQLHFYQHLAKEHPKEAARRGITKKFLKAMEG